MITRQLFFKYFHTKSPLNSIRFTMHTNCSTKCPNQTSPLYTTPCSIFLHQNRPFQALNMFHKQIYEAGVAHIDEVSTTLAVKACRGDPKLGSQIHAFALTSGLDSFLSVSNSLMHMYSKSGQLDRALVIFNKLSNPDTVSWNTLLSGFKDNSDALSFACRMNRIGVTFDAVTYTTALAHCADCEEFMFGIQLHSLWMLKRWFDEMPSRDLVSWNAILSGYSQEGSYEVEAFTTFVEMVRLGLKLDHVSFTSAVSACGHARNLRLGKQIHGFTIKKGYGTHESVCNVFNLDVFEM
ncbi:putative tetratricopeptide-like helical domain superfamily [Helianthus annuus]|nr:putative tetratricopeptide-like helical domain superfamily [Helianthus annuus]